MEVVREGVVYAWKAEEGQMNGEWILEEVKLSEWKAPLPPPPHHGRVRDSVGVSLMSIYE